MPKKPSLIPYQQYWRGFVIALIFFLIYALGIFNFRENASTSLRLRIIGEHPAHSDIVIIGIDDKSLSALGQWPWARSVHGAILQTLARYEPRTVFFDILFTEPSKDPAEDLFLADSIRNMAHAIVPFYYYSEHPFQAVFPMPVLRAAADLTGFVNVAPDWDGITRKFKAILRTDEGPYFHPAVLAALSHLNDPKAIQEIVETWPLDSEGRLYINYPGTISSFKSIPVWEIIDAAGSSRDMEMLKIFKDKIVLIGHVATGTTDLRPTAFSPAEPGVSIQASAVHTLLTQRFLKPVHWAVHLGILLVLALLVSWAADRYEPKKSLLIVIGITFVYEVLNLGIFGLFGWVLLTFLPLVVIIAVFISALFMKYLETRFQGELLSRELQTASRIQENFLPHEQPAMNPFDVAFECRFVKQVGGDLYDWTVLDEDRLGLCLGDVSGKGVPAALYMAKVIGEFRREDKFNMSPDELNARLNKILVQSGPAGMFVTLFYGIVNKADRTLTYSSAGHDAVVFYSAKDQTTRLVQEAQGAPLGLFEEMEFTTDVTPFEPGDLFIVISDGIKELRNPKEEEFGMERLVTIVDRYGKAGKSSQAVIDEVFKETTAYRKTYPAHDDRTIMCVRFNPE